MTASQVASFAGHRGTIYYTVPANTAKPLPARLPTPPCRPRQRRPHSIHITRLPASYGAQDSAAPRATVPQSPRSPVAPKPVARFCIRLEKLVSRESLVRALGVVFCSPRPEKATLESTATPALPKPSSSPPSPRPSITAGPEVAESSPEVAEPPADLPIQAPSPRRRPSGLRIDVDGDTMYRAALATNTGTPRGLSPVKRAVSTVHEVDAPVASGNGVTCSVILAEPTIFLAGLDHDGTRDSSSNTTAILRGKVRLNVTKSVKIKTVTLKFTGRARTEWPEGIPPHKTELYEEESLRTQVIPFFNALYDDLGSGYGTLCNYALEQKSATESVTSLSSPRLDVPSAIVQSTFTLPILGTRSHRSSTVLSAKEAKRLSLQSTQSRSFTKGESPVGPTPQQKGFKVFHPGVYDYSFELPIDNNCPETTRLPMASVIWMLEVMIERAGTFKPNLQGFREVPVVRSPAHDSLELVEPISISRKWEDQLHYDIMISGKSFPLGSRIPIAFKLTPLAKVRIHKLKVFVSETVEYYTSNKKVTRKDVPRKILLLEKIAGKPLADEYHASNVRTIAGGELGPDQREEARAVALRQRQRASAKTGVPLEPLPEPTENMLGDIDLGLESYWGQTEIEMNVQLPTCEMMSKDRTKRLVHDCTWKNVNVHHWIKIVMRISRADASDPTGKKRRHFEISIDSPLTLLNCRASQANLELPEYSGLDAMLAGERHVCGCPNATATATMDSPASSTANIDTDSQVALPDLSMESMGLARPQQAHFLTNAAAGVQRPMHMLRTPSYGPPPFDAEDPPPPMPTPPPQYDHIVGTPSHDGLADYFARLGEEYDDDHTDDEDLNRATTRGRVNIANPRTPGGRIARSMEIDRNFMFSSERRNTNSSQGTMESAEIIVLDSGTPRQNQGFLMP